MEDICRSVEPGGYINFCRYPGLTSWANYLSSLRDCRSVIRFRITREFGSGAGDGVDLAARPNGLAVKSTSSATPGLTSWANYLSSLRDCRSIKPRGSINFIRYPGLTSWANYLSSLRDWRGLDPAFTQQTQAVSVRN